MGLLVNSETRHRLKTCNQSSETLWEALSGAFWAYLLTVKRDTEKKNCTLGFLVNSETRHRGELQPNLLETRELRAVALGRKWRRTSAETSTRDAHLPTNEHVDEAELRALAILFPCEEWLFAAA